MEHNRKIGKKSQGFFFSKLFRIILWGLKNFLLQNFSSIFLQEIFAVFFALFWVSQNVRTNQRKGRGRQCEISFEHCKGTYAFAIPKYFRIV